jgi:hypothetical protein
MYPGWETGLQISNMHRLSSRGVHFVDTWMVSGEYGSDVGQSKSGLVWRDRGTTSPLLSSGHVNLEEQ